MDLPSSHELPITYSLDLFTPGRGCDTSCSTVIPVGIDMDTVSERPSVVIDLGSGTIKAGFGGEDAPRAVFPSVVGAGRGGRYVGAEAMAKQSLLKMSYPIQHGVIASWDDAVALLQHTFQNELRAA